MVWNKSLGKNLQRFLVRHPDLPVVVLTGSGHAMKHAIPEEAYPNSGISYKVVLPEVSEYNRYVADKEDADYLILSDDAF